MNSFDFTALGCGSGHYSNTFNLYFTSVLLSIHYNKYISAACVTFKYEINVGAGFATLIKYKKRGYDMLGAMFATL